MSGDFYCAWWRHQMETFSALLAICAGNSPASGEFPAQRPVTRSFDVFFDVCLNKQFRKQSWCWWFEMPSRPLWRHCNEHVDTAITEATGKIHKLMVFFSTVMCVSVLGSIGPLDNEKYDDNWMKNGLNTYKRQFAQFQSGEWLV